MYRAVLIAAGLATAVAACAASSQGRFVDPYTCEVENPEPGDPPYDPDCIRAAQNAAEAAAKAAKKK